MYAHPKRVKLLLNFANCVAGEASQRHVINAVVILLQLVPTVIQILTDLFKRTSRRFSILARLLVQHQVVEHLRSRQRKVLIVILGAHRLTSPVEAGSFFAIISTPAVIATVIISRVLLRIIVRALFFDLIVRMRQNLVVASLYLA